MKANVGSYDAAARFVAGCTMLIFANHGQRWGLAGFALLLTCAGWCPLYGLLRIGTKARTEPAPRRPCRAAPRAAKIISAPPPTRRAAERRTPDEFFSLS